MNARKKGRSGNGGSLRAKLLLPSFLSLKNVYYRDLFIE
jgi:hypothetical protein